MRKINDIALNKRFFFFFDFNLQKLLRLTVFISRFSTNDVTIVILNDFIYLYKLLVIFQVCTNFISISIVPERERERNTTKYGKKHFKWSKNGIKKRAKKWMDENKHATGKKQHEWIVDGFYWWRMEIREKRHTVWIVFFRTSFCRLPIQVCLVH